ncbi:hypothetical protein Hte_002629 [Hypoxylon texense]
MPGFASILNSGSDVPNDKAIQVYYGTTNAQLAMQLHDKTTDDDDSSVKFHSAATEPSGILINPSQLTSTIMTTMNAVFGFTSQKTTGSSMVDISLISPVFEKVASTESTNKTIASCCSKNKAWVYYLSGADESKLKIIQLQVGGEVKTTKLDASAMRYGTSLAAYYDTKKKAQFVIFQHKVESDGGDNRHLYEYKVDSSTTKIDNSGDAGKLTSIAAVYHDGQTYLYYTDNDNELRVITKKDGDWGSSAEVKDASKANSSSQITAVSCGDANHLFYTDADDASVHLRLPYS